MIFGAAALTITLFALTPTTTRIAIAQIDGLNIGIFRTVGVGVVAGICIIVFRLQAPNNFADWRLLTISALGNFAAFPILFSIGSQSTSASHAALMMAVMPLFVGLIGIALDRRTPGPGWYLGAAMAIAGEVALISFRIEGSSIKPTVLGDLTVLSSCILFSTGVAAGARLAKRISPWSATFWSIAIAGVGLSPVAMLRLPAIPWSTISLTTWVALLHVTIGATILANVTWVYALSRGGISRIAPLQFVQPILALLFASIILGEPVTPATAFAGFLIIAGVVTAYQAATSRRESKEADLALADIPVLAGSATNE